MRPLFSLFLIFSVFSSVSHAVSPDVYFADEGVRDDRHFVKIDRVRQNGISYVQLAGCDILGDHQHAVCDDIALVEEAEFPRMRNCSGGVSAFAAVVGVGGSFFVAVIGGVASGGALAPVGVGGMAYSAYKLEQGRRQGFVFDESVEKDRDHTFDLEMTYEKFIGTLKSSLDDHFDACDVAGHSVRLHRPKYTIPVSL